MPRRRSRHRSPDILDVRSGQIPPSASSAESLDGDQVLDEAPPPLSPAVAALRREIESVQARLDVARRTIQAGDDEVKTALATELTASRRAISAMDHQHAERLSAIETRARDEAERLVSAAHELLEVRGALTGTDANEWQS